MKRNPTPIERRPDWFWMTRNQKKRLAELLQGSMVMPKSSIISGKDLIKAGPKADQKSSAIQSSHLDKSIWKPGDE
jgi:hypothetical protein